MSNQGSPRVQVKTSSPFGERIQDVNVDSNKFNPIDDLRYVTLHRLSLPARFEHLVADVVLWVSSTSFLTSLVAHGVSIGLLSTGVVGVLSLAILIPVLIWGIWLNAMVDSSFKAITGIRVLLVLIGLIIGVAI